ncbi:MAG: glycosyltransferase family 9 protein, partial [Myxococcota bacterium]
PAILGMGTDDVRQSGPYLAADPTRAHRFLAALPPARLRIGVSWQGNPDHPDDRFRSFRLSALAAVAALPGVQLVSLQRGHGAEQIDQVGFEVHRLGSDLDADGAFLDTAAVLSRLDLVIACDSAVGHLAGALDVPCFLALAYAPCWRWIPGVESTPWYRCHRLFHPPTPHDTRPVFAAMAEAIGSMLA